MTINAFHPLFVQTYMPQFMSTLRAESNMIEAGKINGAKSKAHRESVKGKAVNTINIKPKGRRA